MFALFARAALVNMIGFHCAPTSILATVSLLGGGIQLASVEATTIVGCAYTV